MSIDLINLEARLHIAESLVNKAADHSSATAAHDYAIRSLIEGVNLLIVEVKEMKQKLSTTSYQAYRAYSRSR